MSIKDTAVGAILEIPQQALDNIYKAQRAIEGLQVTSKHAADEVSKHWGTTAVNGLTQFIQKLNEAMGGLSGKTVNINMTGLEQSMTQAANTTQTQTQRISDSVQDIGRIPIDFSKPKESLESLIVTFEQLRTELTHLRSDRERHVAGSSEAQNLNNVIEALKEYIALKEKSNAQLARATTPSDKAILDEQKALMTQILQLTKDINAENKKQEREKALGRTIPQEDIDRLRKYREDLEKLNISYDTLKGKIDGMSAGGAKLFNEADVRNSLALTREQGDAQEKLNQALQMTAKLTSDVKLKGGNVTSSEYGVYRNEQVTVYAQMIEMIKKKGEVEAQVASQGYAQTAAQTNLLQTIDAEYKRLESTLSSVAGKYIEIDLAVKSAFDNTKIMQEAENAAKLADAQKKAEGSAAQLAAEYKRLDAEFKKLNTSLDQYNDKIAGKPMAPAQGQALEASANALVNRMANVATRMREIERKNIDEVNAYRQQKDMEANQKSISDFIQAEAQKTAASRQAAEQRLARYRASLQEYQGAMRQADAVLSGTGVNHLATNLENVKRAIADLKAASGSLNLLNPADVKKAEDLKKKIAELETLLKKYKNAATPDKPVISPQDAINAAKTATTLKQLEDAYKRLKEVMANTAQGSDWNNMNTQLSQTKKTIDDIKKKMGEFHNETQRTSNMMGNLQNRIAAAFSVRAIMGFAKKVTEVRAQFELQRVALGAIIQDKDEANKIFLQVQQMALESPFSIMQLERATKQVAAFGFEAKSLVPTMKMVADIGAGLGVELDRIVLVLGHMKARGYLEGTMVRQFTNMGFNVLGELAKYYTELEGRMVSVADVQERVKKKMVEFGDVEEVLKRVTSAGGMFYDMQKKQSDSIWGQMQRITDSYDLMLNEIGQSNEGSIKAALTAIRTLINSWRTLLPIIKAAGAAMILYFARISWAPMLSGLAKMTSGFSALRTIIIGTKAEIAALNATQMASGWGALLAVVGAVAVGIWEVVTAQSKLNEELERTQSEGISDMYGLIFQYRTLSDTVKDSTKSYDERKKALDEIKRVYKDILPDYMTEVGYIKSITDGYKEATEAIKAYSAEKIKKNMREAVENEYGKEIQNAISSTSRVFSAIIKISDILPDDMDPRTIQGAISNIMTAIVEEVMAGTLKQEEVNKEFRERFKRTFNLTDKDISSTLSLRRWFAGWDDELQDVLSDMTDKVGEATTLGLTETLADFNIKPTVEQFKNLKNAVTNFQTALAGVDDQGGFSIFDKATESLDEMQLSAVNTFNNSLAALNQYREALGLTPLTLEEVRKGVDSAMDSNIKYREVAVETFTKQLDLLEKTAKASKNEALLAWVENMRKEVAGINLTPTQKEIEKVILSVEELNGINLGDFKWAIISGATSVSDARKDVETSLKQLKDDVQRYQTAVSNGMMPIVAQMLFLQGQTVDEVIKKVGALTKVWEMLGGSEKSHKKSGGSKSDKELKRWQDLKKAIEDVFTAYDKARKSFSVEESNRQIEKLFGPTFKELGADIKDFYKDGTYDAESLIDALEVLLGMTKATTEERKKFRSEMLRKIADRQVEIDVKLKEDSEQKLKSDLDRMFDSYDLSKTLMDANIPVNLVPMVGGEPIKNLDELRDRIQSKYDAAGGKSASENDVKTYEDALKKIDDLEVKQQQERLKSYQQYLAVMYSDRAKTMIKSYTTLKNMERDFAAYRENLEKEASDPAITESRKRQIAEQIKTLESQAKEAIGGVRTEMDQKLNQFDWNAFKGSPVFTQMYSDLQTLSKKGIDMLIVKLTAMRDKLQSMSDVDYRAVREMTQYIEKLNTQRIELDSWKELNSIIKQSNDLRKQGYDMDTAQKNLMDAQSDLDAATAEIDNLNTIINLKRQEGENADKTKNLSAEQLALYDESDAVLQDMLKNATANANAAQQNVNEWSGVVKTHKDANAALEAQLKKVKMLQDNFDSVYDAALSVADALGADTEVWGDFAKGIGDSIFQVIILTKQLQIMGVAAKSALGIIGYVVSALQGIANLLVAIFAAHDKSLQKQIKVQEEKVEMLQRAYGKLKDSIDNAFKATSLQSDSRKAMQNLEAQKRATEEMISLEEQKKNTDDDQIKQWREDIADINDQMQELKDDITEKWGGFGSQDNYASAAEEFASAWLDAFKETGDGLDALNEKWDEYIDNLIKQQIMLRIVGPRIESFLKMVDEYVSAGSDQGEYLSKNELDNLVKAKGVLLDGLNEELKMYAEAMGWGQTGEFILSDLQKGIQNITEPQAAAIEAYLNSMRFAVFRHTEQLDSLIAIVGAQYGAGVDNPVVTELKGIRMVLDNIDRRLGSVIETKAGIGTIVRIG